MAYDVIDISHHQNDAGTINWQAVKNAGIWGVVIKAGGSDEGFYKDSKFETNYAGAKSVGLHVGTYYFVGKDFKSTADGEADAKRFEAMIKGKQFDLPVYLDVDTGDGPRPENRNGNTDAAIAFCEYLESKGYYVGIYGSDIAGFVDRLDRSRLKDYTWWVAKYSTTAPKNAVPYGMWQYTSTGRVSGITDDVDRDYCYVDYPTTITAGGYNGYGKGTTPAPSPAPTPAPSAPAATTYTVVSGDNLSSIAAKYGTTWQAIYNDNKSVIGSDPNLIKPGMVLTIGGANTSGGTTYTVVSGDNLSKIAAKYGTTWQALYEKNKAVIGSNPNLIKPGMVLTI